MTVPFWTSYDYGPGLAALGKGVDALTTSWKQDAKQQQYLSALGKAKVGDWGGAAEDLAATGDIASGLAMLKQGADRAGAARAQGLIAENPLGPSADPNSPPAGGYMSQLPQTAPGASPAAPTSAPPSSPGPSPTYETRTVQIESGGNPNAVSSTGAIGIAQFTGSTARAVGLADPFDPEASIAATRRLAMMNRPALVQALGREPTDAEYYLAHQQGAGGAAKLLANPNARAGDIVGDRAVAVNGGDPNMTAGQFAQLWIGKFDRTNGGAGASILPQPQRVTSDGFTGGLPTFDAGAEMPTSSSPISTVPAGPSTVSPAPAGGRTMMLPQGAQDWGPPAPAGGYHNLAPQPSPVQVAPNNPSFAPSTTGSVPMAPAAPASPPAPTSDPLVVIPGINGGKPINQAWVRAQPDDADVPEDGQLEAAQAKALGKPAPQPPSFISPRRVQLEAYQAKLGEALGEPTIPEASRKAIEQRLSVIKDQIKEELPGEGAREFIWAKANGLTSAKNPAEYAREKSGTEDAGEKVASTFAARQKVLKTMGIDPASENGQFYLATGKLPDPGKAGEMRATEARAYKEVYEKKNALTSGIDQLQRALAISEGQDPRYGAVVDAKTGQVAQRGVDIYSGDYQPGLAKFVGRNVPGLGIVDPNRLAATTDYNNLVSGATLSQGKELFGARVTNYDEKLLQDLKANPNMAPQERAAILREMIAHRQRTLGDVQQEEQGIKAGTFFRKGGAATSGQPAPDAPVRAQQQGGAVRVGSPEEAAQLAPGTHFIGHDGIERVRQ